MEDLGELFSLPMLAVFMASAVFMVFGLLLDLKVLL